MIRDPANNRITNPVQDAKRERNTNIKNGIKTETAQAESQDSSFPTEGHQAILHKATKRSKKNTTWTNIFKCYIGQNFKNKWNNSIKNVL